MMRKIGVTGGIGSGKSAVLAYLKEAHGAYVLQADALAKELEEPGQVCYEALLERFGKGILTTAGGLDHGAFAALIFSDEEKRNAANAIIHPAVKEEVLRRIAQKEAEGCALFVLEAALLIEEHYDEILDALWYVYVPDEVRIERLMKGRSYSREKCVAIMRRQKSDMEFRRHCTKMIDNSGELWEMRSQVDALLF